MQYMPMILVLSFIVIFTLLVLFLKRNERSDKKNGGGSTDNAMKKPEDSNGNKTASTEQKKAQAKGDYAIAAATLCSVADKLTNVRTPDELRDALDYSIETLESLGPPNNQVAPTLVMIRNTLGQIDFKDSKDVVLQVAAGLTACAAMYTSKLQG